MVSPGWTNGIEEYYYEPQKPGWFEHPEGPRFGFLEPKVEFVFPNYVKVKKGMIIRAGNTKYLVVRKYRNKVWAVPASDTCP